MGKKPSGSCQAHGRNESPPGSPRRRHDQKFDKDGDGKLSPEELQSIPPHHGQPGPHHAVPGGPKGPRMPNMDGPRRPGGPRAEGPALPEDRKAAEAVKDAVKTVTGAPTATALTVPVPSLTPTAPRSWLPDGS
ncbi:MAG: EF-hand domain-containing protein [Akkermansia sp.]